jgi:hypothetical protein
MTCCDPCDYAHAWEVPTIPGGVTHTGPYVYVPRASLPASPASMEGFDPTTAEGKLTLFLRRLQTDFHHWSYDTDWTLESGPAEAPSCIDIVVPYSYYGGCNDYFAGGCWNPGDAPEVETGVAWFVDDDGIHCEVSLLPPEQERIDTWIAEHPPEPDYGDDY